MILQPMERREHNAMSYSVRAYCRDYLVIICLAFWGTFFFLNDNEFTEINLLIITIVIVTRKKIIANAHI
jgi:hypothetical protein